MIITRSTWIWFCTQTHGGLFPKIQRTQIKGKSLKDKYSRFHFKVPKFNPWHSVFPLIFVKFQKWASNSFFQRKFLRSQWSKLRSHWIKYRKTQPRAQKLKKNIRRQKSNRGCIFSLICGNKFRNNREKLSKIAVKRPLQRKQAKFRDFGKF